MSWGPISEGGRRHFPAWPKGQLDQPKDGAVDERRQNTGIGKAS